MCFIIPHGSTQHLKLRVSLEDILRTWLALLVFDMEVLYERLQCRSAALWEVHIKYCLLTSVEHRLGLYLHLFAIDVVRNSVDLENKMRYMAAAEVLSNLLAYSILKAWPKISFKMFRQLYEEENAFLRVSSRPLATNTDGVFYGHCEVYGKDGIDFRGPITHPRRVEDTIACKFH